MHCNDRHDVTKPAETVLRAEVESLMAIVESMRHSLSMMCSRKERPLFEEYRTYFEKALKKLGQFDLNDRESVAALVVYSKELEDVSLASLAALQRHGSDHGIAALVPPKRAHDDSVRVAAPSVH